MARLPTQRTQKIELIPQAIRFFYPKGLTYHTKKFTVWS